MNTLMRDKMLTILHSHSTSHPWTITGKSIKSVLFQNIICLSIFQMTKEKTRIKKNRDKLLTIFNFK
jgi:hypothetical protein